LGFEVQRRREFYLSREFYQENDKLGFRARGLGFGPKLRAQGLGLMGVRENGFGFTGFMAHNFRVWRRVYVRIPGRMPGACVLGRSRRQTSEFLSKSEFPTELPTHSLRDPAGLGIASSPRWFRESMRW